VSRHAGSSADSGLRWAAVDPADGGPPRHRTGRGLPAAEAGPESFTRRRRSPPRWAFRSRRGWRIVRRARRGFRRGWRTNFLPRRAFRRGWRTSFLPRRASCRGWRANRRGHFLNRRLRRTNRRTHLLVRHPRRAFRQGTSL